MRTYIKHLDRNDLFMADGTDTVYRADLVISEGGYTTVEYTFMDGTGFFVFTKPSMTLVTAA